MAALAGGGGTLLPRDVELLCALSALFEITTSTEIRGRTF